jgi:K+-sensing histidine kinase KdpD
MSHDIRNHLQQIQVASELLQYIVDTSKGSDLIAEILQGVTRSSQIIAESRTIATLAELPLEERSLDIILKDTILAAIVTFEDVEFRMSIQVNEAIIKADEYLELLISDLVSNACERSRDGEKQIQITLKELGSVYELAIFDNGPQVNDEMRKNLFNGDMRLRGLHLHLAHYIIEKYGGAIQVNEDDYRGLSIRVAFPKF